VLNIKHAINIIKSTVTINKLIPIINPVINPIFISFVAIIKSFVVGGQDDFNALFLSP